MKVLVLGNRGQVGLELMRAAWPPDTRVAGLSRPEIDLTEPATVEAAFAHFIPTVVVNAAAYTSVDRAESDQAQAFAVNATGPDMLASACVRRGALLIQLSTDYVFDGSASRPYREDDAIGPINAYGHSKAAGEAAVRLRQPRHVILRTSWVYAAQGQNFVRTMLRIAGERTLRVIDDQRGTPTAAGDVAAAVVTIASRLAAGTLGPDSYGTYHFTAVGHTTWYGFADEVFRCHADALGWRPQMQPIPASAYPTPARRPANSCLDCTRIERTFQIRRPPWRESVARVVGELLSSANSDRRPQQSAEAP